MTMYGVFKESIAEADESKLQEFQKNGYIVLDGILTGDKSSELVNKIFFYLKRQEEEAISRGINLEKMNEANLLRCPLFYDRVFYETMCLNPKVLPYVKRILGDYFQLHLQNAIINKPEINHHQSTWHRDLPYQPFIPSRAMSIGVLVCLTDFNLKNGGTFFAKDSHRISDLDITIDYLDKKKETVEVKAGGAILFDSFLWHRAGYNSSDTPRVGVNNMFTTPVLKQQISLPDYLPSDYCKSEIDRNILGFTWQEPRSVLDLRKKKQKL